MTIAGKAVLVTGANRGHPQNSLAAHGRGFPEIRLLPDAGRPCPAAASMVTARQRPARTQITAASCL